jgi:hypothetical protein
MKRRLTFLWLVSILFLILAPYAMAHTTWYVDGVNGNDGNDCKTRQTACKTIGHAIALASSGDTIGVGPATYTENLQIGISLNLIGSGASTTIIDGGGLATVLTIDSGASVILSKFTIRNGRSRGFAGGGVYNSGTLTIGKSTISGNSSHGVYNSGTLAIKSSIVSGNRDSFGAGVVNDGTLTITDSTVSGNGTLGCGGGILNGDFNTSAALWIYNSTITGNTSHCGGGIRNAGTLTINESTVSQNVAHQFCVRKCIPGDGGGISIFSGTATISNSTISGNSATDSGGDGGGVNSGGNTVTINNSTISENGAASVGGNIYGPATLQNSIVANSTSGGNCSGTITSNGYNLSSDNSCNLTGPGDLNNTDPKLGPLQNNGGPTQTMALPSGSPAIDAGNPSGCTDGLGHLLKTDQRGMPRPDKEDSGGCDMGAYERQSD